ncbi:MAG: LapA family protein [Deltaproteobacteria bacterium]|nr:LapA family protein [Deltaproteobacteria bacterium]
MRSIKILILAILFVIALVLIIQNQAVFTQKFELKLDLMVYQIGPYITSNLVIVVAAFLIGVFFAIIWGAFSSVAARSRLREKDKRIKELEKQQRRETLIPSFNPINTEKTEEEAKQEAKQEKIF